MESKYYRKLDNSNPLIGQENQFYKRKEILKEIVEFNNQEKQIRKKIANKETSSKQFNYSLPYLNLNYKESFLDDLTNKRDLQYFGKLENRNKKIFENVENYNYYISKNQNDSEFNKKQYLIKNLQEKQMKEINGNRNSEFIRRTLKLKDSNYNKSIAIEKSNNIFNKFNFLNEGKNILQETVKSNFKLNEVISKEEALIESLKDYDFPTSIKFIKKFNSHQNKNFNSEHKGLIAKLRVKLMAQNVENSIEFYLELINQKDPFSTSLIDFFNFNNIVRNYYGIVFDYKEVEGYFSSFTSDLAHRKLDFCNLLIDASGMTYRKKYLTKNEYRLSFIKTNLVLKLGNNSFQNKSLHSYYTSIIESFLSFIELYFSQNCEVVTNSEFVFFISCLSFKIEFFKDSNREDIFKDYLELLDLL